MWEGPVCPDLGNAKAAPTLPQLRKAIVEAGEEMRNGLLGFVAHV